MSNRLAGRKIVITGAATGIGKAVAEAYVAEGAKVVVADLSDVHGARTASEIGSSAHFVQCDVSEENAVINLMSEAHDWLGGLDGLVNNAGLQLAGSVENFTQTGWDALMAVNARGVFLTTKHAVGYFPESGGSIINTSSLAAKRGGPGITAYAASKGAVMAFSTASALELAPRNIRVNSVCPGFIDTPFNGPAIDYMGGRDAQAVLVKKMVPLGRQAVPGEVAGLYVYLMSDESAYVTAQAYSIDGGVYN